MRHRFLFRAGWKHIFCVTGFENVSPGDGSDWVKETHCVVKAEWKCIFIWFDFLFCFMNFLFFIFAFILFVVCLQNRQVTVTFLGRCCRSGRRAPQSPNWWWSWCWRW